MKAELHLPTEQYGFVSVEVEVNEPHEAVALYNETKRKLENPGVPEKELNYVIDKMLLGESVEGGLEIYEKMNEQQKSTVQCLKRALRRLKAKE
jgi:hypothetical protein